MCKKWVIDLLEESVLDDPNIEDEIDLTEFDPSSSSKKKLHLTPPWRMRL